MLMIAESKKKAIDEDVIKRAQKEEYEKARKWKKDTLKKLSFLKSYGCEFESDRFRSSFLIHPKKRGTIEVALVWHMRISQVSTIALLDTIQKSLLLSIGITEYAVANAILENCR